MGLGWFLCKSIVPKSQSMVHRPTAKKKIHVFSSSPWTLYELDFFKETKNHGDVIKWKHFPCYWPFVRRIHQSPVNSTHKGQWCGALMFCSTCALNKQLWGWWFETPSRSLWHCNVYIIVLSRYNEVAFNTAIFFLYYFVLCLIFLHYSYVNFVPRICLQGALSYEVFFLWFAYSYVRIPKDQHFMGVVPVHTLLYLWVALTPAVRSAPL